MANILHTLEHLPIIETILKWSKKTALPGFQNVPIFYIVKFIFQEIKKDNITTRADAVAFNFFISLFPFIIFILPIIANTPFGINYLDLFRQSIKGVLPVSAENYIFQMVDGIQQEGNFGLLSIGFFLAIFFASNGMSTLMTGFDKTYASTFRKRNYFTHRLVAIGLTLLLVILGIVSITMIILFQQIMQFMWRVLELEAHSLLPFGILRWIILILLFYSVITSIYRYGPSMFKRIKFFSAGATLATFLSIFSSVLFSYFVNQFGRYNEIYGSISALIVMLIWLQINAFILLVGFELNASIAVNRDLGRVKSNKISQVETSNVQKSDADLNSQ